MSESLGFLFAYDWKENKRNKTILATSIGNEVEWNGAWSDKSPKWNLIPNSEKHELGFAQNSDGEFW